jgi:hypothetical protein
VALYQAALMEVAVKADVQLALAGGGAWKEAPGVSRVVTFKDLRERLAS